MFSRFDGINWMQDVAFKFEFTGEALYVQQILKQYIFQF